MTKPIEYRNEFNIHYIVEEESDFPEVENITFKIAEYDFDLDESDASIELYQKDNYLEIEFTRIIIDEHNGENLFDILDSISSDIVKSVYPVMNVKNEEFMSEALDIPSTAIVSKIIYLRSANIKGNFDEDAIAAATSKAFKMLAKGTDHEHVVMVSYQNMTFYNNDIDIENPKEVIKSLNLFKLPSVASGVAKKDNVVAIASGMTINYDYQQVDEYSNSNTKKQKLSM